MRCQLSTQWLTTANLGAATAMLPGHVAPGAHQQLYVGLRNSGQGRAPARPETLHLFNDRTFLDWVKQEHHQVAHSR